MSGTLGQIVPWAAGLGAALVALFGGLVVLPKLWGRLVRLRWWLAGLAVLVLAVVFLIVLPRAYPPEEFGPSVLPRFIRRAYWAWMLLFLLGSCASILSLVGRLTARRRGVVPAEVPEGEWAADPELDAAWSEILVRLEHARIAPSRQKVYLLLAPDEGWAEALVRAAGLQVFVQAPERLAPIHAFATSDGVLLSCAGASAFGAHDEAAAARLEGLCHRLLALQPDCPVVRGVAVLFPIDSAWAAQSVRDAASVRADLGVIRRALGVRCPVFALVPGMEAVPGFVEFLGRLAAQAGPRMLEQRVGFAVPSAHEFSGDLVQRGLTWMSAWFHSWILNLIAGDPLNHRGNAELVTLDHEIRRHRKRLRAILESAFATPRESDPVLFRGCYFLATGSERSEQAFAAGLFRGARSRVLADHIATRWTTEAEWADRRYQRLALAVGLVGGLPTLLGWAAIIQRTPWGWLGLLVVVIAWIVVLLRYRPA
ncbi:MAG: hypothetical protein IRY99_12710 [Isosphaeraceae bacterium]|nr:hypothetical protein [Isosphaeraceae bacterium]